MEYGMKKQKNSTDNYEQTQRGTGQNSTDNMNDGPIDKKMKPKSKIGNPKFYKENSGKFRDKPKKTRAGEKFMDLYQSKMGRKNKDGKLVKDY